MWTWIKTHKVTTLFILLGAILVGVSSFLTFKEDSTVVRSYFIDEYKRAVVKTNEERLTQPAILTPAQTYNLTLDANSIAQVKVKRGQEIFVDDELVIYQTNASEQQQELIQKEIRAYEAELATLTDVLYNLQSAEGSDVYPNSYISANQDETLLDIQIDLQLQSQTTMAGAISVIERHLAETQRELDLATARLDQIQLNNAEISPFDGVVGDIYQQNDHLILTIYALEKSATVFVDHQHWKKIQPDQLAELSFADLDEPLAASVAAKSSIVADQQSIWAQEYKKYTPLNDSTYYEIDIVPTDGIIDLPYASTGNATIVLQEVMDSYRVHSDWLVHTTISDEETNELLPLDQQMLLDDRGKIAKVDATVAFEDKHQSIVVAPVENGTLLLNDTARYLDARTFVSYPWSLPSWTHMKETTWKDYLRYFIHSR